jgi:hypothetical protein
MDNEASAALKKYFTEKEMNYQLPPPRIATELMLPRGQSGLSKNTSNPAFHVHLWDILLPQTEITLNILRSSRFHSCLKLRIIMAS